PVFLAYTTLFRSSNYRLLPDPRHLFPQHLQGLEDSRKVLFLVVPQQIHLVNDKPMLLPYLIFYKRFVGIKYPLLNMKFLVSKVQWSVTIARYFFKNRLGFRMSLTNDNRNTIFNNPCFLSRN